MTDKITPEQYEQVHQNRLNRRHESMPTRMTEIVCEAECVNRDLNNGFCCNLKRLFSVRPDGMCGRFEESGEHWIGPLHLDPKNVATAADDAKSDT